MAQTMTGTAIGRVNRRFLLLAAILAVLFGVLAYVALSDSGGEGGTATGGEIPVVVARVPIPAGTTITESMVQVIDAPAVAVGDQAFSANEAVIGQVARFPIAANEQILVSKVVTGSGTLGGAVLSNLLEEGKRGMAIEVQAVINGGGLILPGDHVDVLWVPERVDQDLVGAGLVAENVEVVAVQQTLVDLPPTAPGAQPEGATPAPGGRVRGSEASAVPEAATVVLLLTPDQAARVFCADVSPGQIRLAVRAFGDNTPSGIVEGVCVIHPEEQ